MPVVEFKLTPARARLPNRRPSHLETLEVDGQTITACVGFDPATIISVPLQAGARLRPVRGSFKAADYKMAYE